MPANVGSKAICLLACFVACLAAQELQPRAYIPAPAGVSFFSIGYSNNRGGLLVDPGLPVEDANVKANFVALGFAKLFGVLGRSAQVLVVIPYAQADVTGQLNGIGQYQYRSGLGDATVRYAMNIHGAPAMSLKQFAAYRQKTIVGASITVSVPIGQYDPNVLVNLGTNRWAFKPELGVSRALGQWTIEGAFGVWLYTANRQYFGQLVRTQVPLGSLQAHVVRLLPGRNWLAFDASYYNGGRSQLNGYDQPNYLGNARFGVTFGWTIRPRHAIRFSYFNGAFARVGNDLNSFGITYNIIWQRGR